MNMEKLEGEPDTAQPGFIPHRIFLNQVDSFHAKHIASYITDQVHGATTKGGDEEEGEGEMEMAPEEEMEPEEKSVKNILKFKYEVVGTLQYSFHNKTEDILQVLNEASSEFTEEVLKCGFVVYDITKDKNEIPKALATLTEMEKEVQRVKEMGPKTFKLYSDIRVFILISTVMTWALTKPIDPDDPELPFTEADYKKRKAHTNYAEHIACEKEVIQKGKQYKDKLKTYVICSGITYGAEEEDLTFLFKLAWYNEKYLPIVQPGKNFVPLIHIKDLAKVVHGVCENQPAKPHYILAVEQTPCTLKQITVTLSKAMGSGRTKEIPAAELFLYNDVTQKVFDRCTVNLNMEPGYITEELEIEWQNELNLPENMKNITEEFKRERNLLPINIIIHGPPGVGKTRLAKKLCAYYGSHYVSVKIMIEETLTELREQIEDEKAKIKNKEDNVKLSEEVGEEEEEEEEGGIEDWQEQLRDIECAMNESENGKLPDDYVVRLMKQHLLKNVCQNQGYILDGYPKTIQQTKELFGQATEGGDEEAMGEEGEAQEGNASNKVLPHYMISLQASDEFLCERIMSLPEHEIHGTQYTEEHMLRRLAEFRTNNTEENTVLNFFDENEIHPFIINAAEDPYDDMKATFCVVIEKIGPCKGFALTPEEEKELMRLEQEKIRLEEKEQRLQREVLEKQAREEYEQEMETWAKLLQEAQMEEEKILAVESEPLREYLIKFVFPLLAKGLIEVAGIKPNDPVDFLAEYLFKMNPEGKMFDPSYTRDGEQLVSELEGFVKEKIISPTINQIIN